MVKKTVFDGQIILIGYGSIGKGVLPLLEKHLEFSPSKLYIIDPNIDFSDCPETLPYTVINKPLTKENYFLMLEKYIYTPEMSLIINVSVDVESASLIKAAQKLNALYIDTATEAWSGFYTDDNLSLEERSNYAMRERILEIKRNYPNGPTAISCCGANPGMVSWFVKQSLLNLRDKINSNLPEPKSRKDWAILMNTLGVKGIHIAERDTQETKFKREKGTFANTWSVLGCIEECLQISELGWGTHEESLPSNGNNHTIGCKSAIYLNSLGGETIVQSWVPTGPQEAFLITHNESISLAEYFSVYAEADNNLLFRPTVHYAYRPSPVTVDSIHELMKNYRTGNMNEKILKENEILCGTDYLGVLLYGHEKNAYWFGSKLTIEETRKLVPNQNATGLQVTSAIISGILWAIENPTAGVVESDEIDFKECLKHQLSYLGTVEGHFTDWSPINETDMTKKWQFSNILLNKKTVSQTK